jgi:hypothetical protein
VSDGGLGAMLEYNIEIENLLLFSIFLSVSAIAVITGFVWCFNRE